MIFDNHKEFYDEAIYSRGYKNGLKYIEKKKKKRNITIIRIKFRISYN